MNDGYKHRMRAVIQEEIDTVSKCLDTCESIARETGWGTQRKHAKQVLEEMRNARVELVNLLYELRDCLRDDEEVRACGRRRWMAGRTRSTTARWPGT